MRHLAFTLVAGAALSVYACSAQQVADTLGLGGGSGSDGGAAAEGGADGGTDAAVLGQGCGVERNTSLVLCRATAQCPNVVVDSEAFPDCGYRVRGSAVDLVCACGTSICPMGAYVTCAQAAQLLTSQTETAICQQVAEGKCAEIDSSSSSSSTSSSTSSSSTSSSSGGSGCDKSCLSDCGGGEACASVCGCN
jgi:hypothetical protein